VRSTSFFKFSIFGVLILSLGVASGVAFAKASFDSERKLLSITAVGEASGAPEFVRLSVSVTSTCYSSPLEAKQANAAVTSKVFEKLKGFETGDEKTLASGVAIIPDERMENVTENNGSVYKKVCPNRWMATQSINLKSSAIDKTAEIQDVLFKAMEEINGPQNLKSVSATKMSMSAPYADLAESSRRKLQLAALKDCAAKAKEEAGIVSAEFDLRDVRLVEFRDGGYIAPQGMEMARSAPMSADGGAQSPVSFDQVRVTESRVFIFSFEN